MRVLFFTNMYPDQANTVKGIYIKNQIDNLKQKGIEVDLLYLKVKNPLIDYVKGIFLLRKILYKNNYDLIHAHYGFMGFISSFQRRVPFVLTLHGSDVNLKWQRFFSKIAYIFAKKVIVTNRLHEKIMGKNSIVIPTGFDADTFKPMDKNIARQTLGLDINRKYLLFPSSKSRKIKNYDLFYKVFTKLKNEDNKFEELTLENLTPQEVNLFLNSCDMLLLTSFYEGSPLIIREALACNIPIVSVNVGDVSLQLNNIPNCAVTSFDPDEIVQKIKNILNNHDLVLQNKVPIRYSIEENIMQTLMIYNEVLGKRWID